MEHDVSTSDDVSESDIAAVLNELLVREIKQIEWISHRGERQTLEELEEFLIPQIDAIARVEATIGNPLARMVTPSQHPRAPLGSSTATDVVHDRLVPLLRAVAVDVRHHARNRTETEADFLVPLADGLDRHADRLES